jgi:hypothetical protein
VRQNAAEFRNFRDLAVASLVDLDPTATTAILLPSVARPGPGNTRDAADLALRQRLENGSEGKREDGTERL